jgi:hypothetical protein
MEATPDKVIYTDGHDVTVTDSTLQVNKHEYKLNGVTKCALMVLRPNRAPGIILLILGLGLIVVGAMQLITPGTIPDVQISNQSVDANTIAIWAGAGLALIGILILGLLRERYSVRIATAEGEKDAVVSQKREYIGQIVDAINQAISFVRTRAGSQYFTVRSAEDKLGNTI